MADKYCNDDVKIIIDDSNPTQYSLVVQNPNGRSHHGSWSSSYIPQNQLYGHTYSVWAYPDDREISFESVDDDEESGGGGESKAERRTRFKPVAWIDRDKPGNEGRWFKVLQGVFEGWAVEELPFHGIYWYIPIFRNCSVNTARPFIDQIKYKFFSGPTRGSNGNMEFWEGDWNTGKARMVIQTDDKEIASKYTLYWHLEDKMPVEAIERHKNIAKKALWRMKGQKPPHEARLDKESGKYLTKTEFMIRYGKTENEDGTGSWLGYPKDKELVARWNNAKRKLSDRRKIADKLMETSDEEKVPVAKTFPGTEAVRENVAREVAEYLGNAPVIAKPKKSGWFGGNKKKRKTKRRKRKSRKKRKTRRRRKKRTMRRRRKR